MTLLVPAPLRGSLAPVAVAVAVAMAVAVGTLPLATLMMRMMAVVVTVVMAVMATAMVLMLMLLIQGFSQRAAAPRALVLPPAPVLPLLHQVILTARVLLLVT